MEKYIMRKHFSLCALKWTKCWDLARQYPDLYNNEQVCNIISKFRKITTIYIVCIVYMHPLKFIEYGASVQKGDTNGHSRDSTGDLFRLLVPSASITIFEVVFGQVRHTQTTYPMADSTGSQHIFEYLDAWFTSLLSFKATPICRVNYISKAVQVYTPIR